MDAGVIEVYPGGFQLMAVVIDSYSKMKADLTVKFALALSLSSFNDVRDSLGL